MKRFVQDIFFGVVAFVCLLMAAECFVLPKVNKEYNRKHDYLEAHKNDISILLMGNSFFENSLNPHLLGDSVYDFAVSSRPIYYDCELLKKYIPQMPNLSVVLFPMGYKMPFWESPHYPENPNINVHLVHEKYFGVWYDRTPEKYLYWFLTYHGGIHRDMYYEQQDSLGYTKLQGQLPGWNLMHNVEQSEIDHPDAKEQVAEYTNYMATIAELCSQYGVRFIVVTPPCSNPYLANVGPYGVSVLHKIISDASKNYPIEYHDYLRDKDFRADSLYYNASHLNSIGADKFAKRLKKDFEL